MKDKQEIIKKIFFTLYIISIIIAGFILCYRFSGEEPDYAEILSLSYLGFSAYAYHKHKLNEIRDMHKKKAWIYDRRLNVGFGYTHLRDWELSEYIEIEQKNQQIPYRDKL